MKHYEVSFYQSGSDQAYVQLIEHLYDSGRFPEYQSLEICIQEILSQFLEPDKVSSIIQEYFPQDEIQSTPESTPEPTPEPIDKKVCAFKLSELYLHQDELPELSKYSSADELNQFLKQDSDAAIALRTKIFQMGLKKLANNGDAYSTAIEIFNE
ncbi:hypothetical protein [Laspinema olomoucense]|uniref:hypothetical protein n=1 Tax=Laspinema olomoucense TaxID=3231600 RepID=UPI0021BB3AE1|nr:hypothetical protein [Laspinema sp. D3d]MCT7971264.1 hypothetical protein [Laspinema sp. D3d]